MREKAVSAVATPDWVKELQGSIWAAVFRTEMYSFVLDTTAALRRHDRQEGVGGSFGLHIVLSGIRRGKVWPFTDPPPHQYTFLILPTVVMASLTALTPHPMIISICRALLRINFTYISPSKNCVREASTLLQFVGLKPITSLFLSAGHTQKGEGI